VPITTTHTAGTTITGELYYTDLVIDIDHAA
jgi:hypothetical protein